MDKFYILFSTYIAQKNTLRKNNNLNFEFLLNSGLRLSLKKHLPDIKQKFLFVMIPV